MTAVVAGARSFSRNNAAVFHHFAKVAASRRLSLDRGEAAVSMNPWQGDIIPFLSTRRGPAMKDAREVPKSEPPTGDKNPSVAASLLERLRAGETRAWERLAGLYGATVYVWCRRAGVSEADAPDVSQEVFSAVARHIADFRRERPGDSFRGWLWTITRNKVRDHRRRHAGQARAAGGTTAQEVMNQVAEAAVPESETGPETRSGDLYRRALELIRSEFEERTWRAFLMVTVEGRMPADVAVELGTTPGAVYIAKSRVLKRLREEFGDLLEEKG